MIWTQRADNPVPQSIMKKNEIIAVHTTGGSKNNFGTKINDEYYQFILDHLS